MSHDRASSRGQALARLALGATRCLCCLSIPVFDSDMMTVDVEVFTFKTKLLFPLYTISTLPRNQGPLFLFFFLIPIRLFHTHSFPDEQRQGVTRLPFCGYRACDRCESILG